MNDIVAISSLFPLRITLLCVVLLSFGLYLTLNDAKKFGGDVLTSGLDRVIPFMPAFSIPYLLYLPFLLWLVTYGILFTPFLLSFSVFESYSFCSGFPFFFCFDFDFWSSWEIMLGQTPMYILAKKAIVEIGRIGADELPFATGQCIVVTAQ